MRLHYPLNANGAEDAGQLPWSDGVPSTGAQGSYPGHAIVTDTEAEILAAIDASGQARNGSDLSQLIQAIARGIYLGQISGTANALAAVIPNNVVFSALQPGTRFAGFVAITNTAGVTFAITGIGTGFGTVQAPLLKRGGAPLQAGDLPVGNQFEIRWDGNNFYLTGPVSSDGLSGIPGNTQIFSAAGTIQWPCPAGVTRVRATLWAAGGGGGGSATTAGSVASSGGAGEYRRGTFVTTPNTNYTIIVGAGGTPGAGGSSPTAGGTGGSSSFSNLMTAIGGGGGQPANGAVQTTTGAGGTGGSGGLENGPGGGGGVAYPTGSAFVLSQGGAAYLGGAATATKVSGVLLVGLDGNGPGGGAQGGILGGSGGTGGVGRVVLEY